MPGFRRSVIEYTPTASLT
ncbi:MAG: hypothetical protein CMQ34_12715 [Gammaproteobacteria bacterium]|nr:hypothetical protein [Gammaproteobacteria bacterium]